ncbi:MAG: hypothetical protein D6690_02185 [Nitrospirae bacterium]|nr:MAG: hypothetical protein D6690_02185 [Nitrospirota bacterium]
MILGAGASASALVDPLRTPSPGHGGMGHGVPFAPSIQAMAITPDEVVYAGSFGMGVFRSSDKGQSWTMINHGLTDLFVLCLAVHPNGDVYAGTVRGGVYRLVHGTTAWESIKTGLKRVEVKSLLIGDRGIYAGTGRGVYRWDEADHQWTMVHQALDQFLIPSMAMLNDRILLAATAGKGLFTVDTVDTKQSTWLRGSSGLVDPKERLPHRYLRIVVVNERQQIFLGTQDGGLFMSTDEGRSWHPISRTLPNDSIRGIVSQDSALYVATGLGVYVLGREDRRWQPINSGLTELSIQTFVMSPAGVLYVGTSQGAFRSDDNGKHWVNVSEGFGLHTYQPRPY